jgi:hypothetical protein
MHFLSDAERRIHEDYPESVCSTLEIVCAVIRRNSGRVSEKTSNSGEFGEAKGLEISGEW